MTQAEQFFSALYAGQSGVLELRTFDHPQANKIRDFVSVNNGSLDHTRVQKFIDATIEYRIGAYFGVALRSLSSIKDNKGDAAHCEILTALFVDADFKHLGEEETKKRIAAFKLMPSMMVCSGGGFHPYWILKQPILLQVDDGMKKAKSYLKRLAMGVADIVDESVSEPVRVLRIPGGVNFKKDYPEPRPVVLLV